MSELILAGDVGGTKTNIALFSIDEGQLVAEREASYASVEFDNLEQIIEDFIGEDREQIGAACIGVAGPIKHGVCELVKLNWRVDERALEETFGFPCQLLNDLVVLAYGVSVLPPESFHIINEGTEDAVGNAVLIAPGTGLGEAALIWDGEAWQPTPSEGGLADFAPANELEIDLLRYIMKQYGVHSVERVVSGPGIQNIYYFLRDSGRGQEEPWLAERLTQEDASAVISACALDGSSPLCQETLKLFVRALGSEAANLSLKVLGLGGVYIGGGIPPKILPLLTREQFMKGFTEKERYPELLAAIPVRVILDDKAAIYGAASYAASMLSDEGDYEDEEEEAVDAGAVEVEAEAVEATDETEGETGEQPEEK